ncbi:SDR family oxidoreductase [Nocardia fusca]|uniref:SDR family oxidoreductase n=1 Tax=Nocardia fusca TaxID=941183 RepID=UPI0037A660D5
MPAYWTSTALVGGGATISQGAIPVPTRSAAVDLGPENIRVSCIETDLVVTPGCAGGPLKSENARIRVQIPMLRRGRAHDVSQVATFLLSDYSTFVNDASIPVDGGRAGRTTTARTSIRSRHGKAQRSGSHRDGRRRWHR